MKTIAIIIGVSDYKDPAFKTIPGAKADAGRFASALASWGLPKKWIHLIPQNQTTKTNVIQTFLNCRSEFDVDAKLIFYFAGHGIRETDIHRSMQESALILNDTDSADPLSTGLCLTELMHLIRTLKPIQTFLFFDACSLRLNQIENPLNDVDVFSLSESKGLFCLFSSGIYPSYEDAILRYGYFTQALLKAMGELRLDLQASCHDILKKVQNSLKIHNLPLPESFYIGSDKMWPLEQHYEKCQENPVSISRDLITRREALATLQDYLVETSTPLIWMWGEGGLGKTTIAEQWCGKNGSAVYLSIPSISRTCMATLQSLIEQVRLQRGALFFGRPPETSLHQTLNYLTDHSPESILILDHLDRLQHEDLKIVLDQIDRAKIASILISRNPCPRHLLNLRVSKVYEWRATPLSVEEMEQLILNSGGDLSFTDGLLHASEGNALKVRQMLTKLSEKEINVDEHAKTEFIQAMSAIVGCGGFLDQQLFSKIFRIKPRTIASLEKLGLIHYTKEGCYPHDTLLEMVHENQWPISIYDACLYWSNQILSTPYNHWACRSLIFFASQIENCDRFKPSLSLCLNTLDQRENLNFIIDLVDIFKKHHWEYLLLKAASYLVDHEEYTLSGELLSFLANSKNPFIKIHAFTTEAKRLVWLGKFHDVIKSYTHILSRCRSLQVLASLRNSIGMALFYSGEWDQAKELFNQNIEAEKKLGRQDIGIAQLMNGTIIAFRKENPLRAKKLLESSIRIFDSAKLYHWHIMALNSLALYFYSLRQWRQAICILNNSLDIARALQNNAFILNVLTITAKVYLRYMDPHSYEISLIAADIEDLYSKKVEIRSSWTASWALIRLGAIHAYRKDISKLMLINEGLIVFTGDIKHPHVYTLLNVGHLASLQKNFEEAKIYYKQAFFIAKRLNNQIAIDDIQEDLATLSSPFTLQDLA